MKQLETERLVIRPWREADLEDLYEYAKSPTLGPRAGWEPHKDREASRAVLETYIEQGEVWALEYQEEGKVVGSLGLHPDGKRSNPRAKMITYALSERYRGKGLLAEAVKRALQYAFEELNVGLVAIYPNASNDRSRRLVERCGFQMEGTLRMAGVSYDGKVFDEVCYSLAKEDYTEFL